MIKLINFDNCEYSLRDGSYGGNAGQKDGLIYNNENWIIKFPKNTSGMKSVAISYTTSPLSEYIGSQIYKILGFDVHETLLGIRNNKIVVGCKDFCADDEFLREMRTIKNSSNKEMSELLDRSFHSTDSSGLIDIEEIQLHLEHNRILKNVPSIKERFWDMVIIDLFINNSDRNNGNWGLIQKKNTFRLAPIFDNGASFSNKMSEERIEKYLNEQNIELSALNTVTRFGLRNKVMSMKDILNYDSVDCKNSILRNTPLIVEHFNTIKNMIEEIPEYYEEKLVCSNNRKEFYIKGMELRIEKALIPAYEKIKDERLNERKTVKSFSEYKHNAIRKGMIDKNKEKVIEEKEHDDDLER